MWLTILLLLAGAFTVTLGSIHIFLPGFLDYRTLFADRALGAKEPRQFQLRPTSYEVTIGDRYGILWVMNHAASFTLISIGMVDLLAHDWLRGEAGRWLALWIAGFWVVRAASQFYLGRRSGDWVILAGFAGLALIHLGVWLP